ncbi:exo-beta-N-acetylmuramidase NamZ family protein [Butyrivibrio sp. MC2021]|uniref:exo-beta-N-acetylmuramidase NamZ family protein n=1 Tax=Butyrivibrio sp. MC2021 TaxID=1408306 RepID=UPI0009E0714A|nr:DUF1343 domain-containing protein [Butyrivibrio sp. MC2021]
MIRGYSKKLGVILASIIAAGTFAACGESEVSNVSYEADTGSVFENIEDAPTEISEASESAADEASDNVSAEENNNDNIEEALTLGDERFEEYLPLLEGKRVALFSNQSGIVGDECSFDYDAAGEGTDLIHFGKDDQGGDVTYGEHELDALIRQDVDVACVLSPEHGFRGTKDAGEGVDDSIDPKTGVPLLSLYEDNRSKAVSDETLDKFDVLVVDIQDVGLRFYTYYITMFDLMDACAEQGKAVIILDRPNPNGFFVDGPILRDEYISNVGKLPIPVAHGMTLGELAQMINGEGWLRSGKDSCDLTVIPCLGYDHNTRHNLIKAPSPNLKDMRAVYLYPSTCLFENTVVSVGRGTENPFETYGSPYLADMPEYDYNFTPVSMEGAVSPMYQDKTCFGKDLRELSLSDIQNEGIQLDYLIDAYRSVFAMDSSVSFWGSRYNDGHYWIDYLMGTDSVRLMIEEGRSSEEIKAAWADELSTFKQKRREYLLYTDFE